MAGIHALSWKFILQRAGGSSAEPSALWDVPWEQCKTGWNIRINGSRCGGDTPVAGAVERKRQCDGWILVNLVNLLSPEIQGAWER